MRSVSVKFLNGIYEVGMRILQRQKSFQYFDMASVIGNSLKKWYFVTKVVLTYGVEKNVLESVQQRQVLLNAFTSFFR